MSKGTKNAVKQWEITFPKSGDIAVRDSFHEFFPPSDYSICCQELHSDGTLHLHLGLILKKGITKSKLLEWIMEKFPNDYKRIHISGIRSMTHWQDYCRKEDPNVFERGSLEKKKMSRYTEQDAMNDVMQEMMLKAKISGEKWKYLHSAEYHELCELQKYLKWYYDIDW